MSKRSVKTTIPSRAFERRLERVQLLGFIAVPVVCLLVFLAYALWKING